MSFPSLVALPPASTEFWLMSPALGVEWLAAPIRPEIRSGEVHLWLARLDRGATQSEILTADERARAARLRFDKDRVRWIASRVLLRTVLAHYLFVGPGALIFETQPRERPVLLWPSDAAWLRFSLAHSGDLALVGVARDDDVGVDIERLRPDRDLARIARRAFGDEVADRLEAAPKADRVADFYRAWVRHEARGKCLGKGLVEPNDDDEGVSVDVADVEVVTGYAAAVATRGRMVRLRRWFTAV
jgi:4'-phosphopantetheinyl transferase